MSATETAKPVAPNLQCWCCGQHIPDEGRAVRLGNHPEVVICLRCAHFLHRRARGLEDALRPSPAARVRDALRSFRDLVIRRGWHRRPVIGPILRLLGRWTP